MAAPTGLLLLLFLCQPWAGAVAQAPAVVCAATACYTAHWAKLSAAEAQRRCADDGGNLATVKNEEEARLVQRSLAQLLRTKAPLEARTGKFWIGLQREKGRCLDANRTLKGFSWVGGEDDTPYANWRGEVRSSCISKRCVSLLLNLSFAPLPSHLPKWSEGPCGSPGAPGSNIEGFVCKFGFKGMCQPLALGGPGRVTYTTPFGATTSSLEAVPFASSADVACGDEDEAERKTHYFLCKEKTPGVFDWGSSGPFCISPRLGCSFNNGGCQQECFDSGDGSFRCGCLPGFRLLDDLVTCASRDPCSSSPCKGEATCISEPHGTSYTCRCPRGYRLDSSLLDCVDVDECQDSPCSQECINSPGGFRCECWVGYQPGGPEDEACWDVNECALGPSPCAQDCVNTDGSFHCFCKEGYISSGEDGTQCEDVNECLDPRGSPCDSLCFNTPGSFHCGCLPRWELAPNGVSCTMSPVTSGLPAGPPQEEDKGDGGGSTVPPAETSSRSRHHMGASGAAPTSRRSFFPSDVPSTSAPPEVSAPSGHPGVWTELGTRLPMATVHGRPSGEDSVAKQSDEGTDGQKLLLFYILGTVVAIALLLALALGLLVYRRRRARREEMKEKKPQSAADSYAWVPERAEGRAPDNQYSPTPGTDC